jgi:hypothetical protein
MALPEEFATTALFLASDGESYINGAEFVVDGGVTALWSRRSLGRVGPGPPRVTLPSVTSAGLVGVAGMGSIVFVDVGLVIGVDPFVVTRTFVGSDGLHRVRGVTGHRHVRRSSS